MEFENFQDWIVHVWEDHVTKTGQVNLKEGCQSCQRAAQRVHDKSGAIGSQALMQFVNDLRMR